jgi:molybdopterin-guanine dinucleotide biosynthesis protein A
VANLPGPIAALLLAGGRASRLGGADKPGITIGGRSLVATVASAAAGAGAGRIVIVGQARPDLAGEVAASGSAPIVEFTSEQPPGAGPVPALRAGLARIPEPWLLLLAADLPFLSAGHLRELLAAAVRQATAGAMFADGQGRPQWLISCWRSAVVRSALDSYGGASLGGVLGPLRPAEVTISQQPGQPPPWMDCDTSADVAAAAAFAHAAGKKAEDRDEHAGQLDRRGLR